MGGLGGLRQTVEAHLRAGGWESGGWGLEKGGGESEGEEEGDP